MSGYIKYFDNGRKNMSFKIEDESLYLKSGIKLKSHWVQNFIVSLLMMANTYN